MFLATIPAVLYVDQFGRKTILIAGGIGMAVSHFIVAGITGAFSDNWDAHVAGGWVAVVFVWFYAISFGFSWGPVAWVIVSEVFPLGIRAKGVSIGASSNWLNNFAVAVSTSDFIGVSQFGAFIFFGCITTIGVIWVYFFVPESKFSAHCTHSKNFAASNMNMKYANNRAAKGRTLEEMDELFGAVGYAQADLARKEKIEHDIGLTALLEGDESVSAMAVTGRKFSVKEDSSEQGSDKVEK